MADSSNSLVQRLIGFMALFFGGGRRRFDAGAQIATPGSGFVLLADGGRVETTREAPSPTGPSVRGPVEQAESRSAAGFLLSVDDAGQFLVATGERLVLGHLRGGAADLPFLADVGPSHAVLERSDSLRGGTIWSVAPLSAEPVRVNGLALDGPVELAAGDLLQLGENLALRFQVPDPASHSALLDLYGGAECGGAKTIILFGAGEGGRLRIGAGDGRHVRVANLPHEITLVRRGARLFVGCEAAISGAEAGAEGFSLPCPPPQRFDLSIGRPAEGRPPFGLALGPVELFSGR